MKKVLFLTAFAMIALAWTSCSKSNQTNESTDESVSEVVVDAPQEESAITEESQSDEAYYDEILDKYEEALKTNDFEVISATSENLGEAEMEGLLTPAQVERWNKLNK